MKLESVYIARLVREFIEGGETDHEPPEGIDWSLIGGLLAAHRLLPALIELLQRSGAPENRLEEMRSGARFLRLRTELLILELSRFLQPLTEETGRVIVLKGAALAHSVYGRTGTRFFVDLDLLVPGEKIEAACGLLRKFGYEDDPSVRNPEFYLQHHFHHVLTNPQGLAVELHWDLTRPRDAIRFDLPGILARSREIPFDDETMQVPANSDQLLHTASQAMSQGFSDLRRIVDTALLLRNGAAGEPGLADRARNQGLATPLWLLLELTGRIAGVTAPLDLETALRPSGFIRRCLHSLDMPGKVVRAFALRRTGFRHLVQWLCCPRPQAALREIARYSFPGESLYLEHGYPPQQLPGSMRRAEVTARHILSTCKLAGYQFWKLAAPSRPTRLD